MADKKSQRGFYLIEAIIVMSVLMSLMSLGSRQITKTAERSANQLTAQQLQQVTQAAQQYVQDHYKDFKDDPEKNVEWERLVKEHYLSDKFYDKNSYGQDYQFAVVPQEEQGMLQVLLTTAGGAAISEASLRQIAAFAGSNAGYTTLLHKDKIVGHQENWFLQGSGLKPGYLASLTIINEKEVMDAANFLRRTQYPGHNEYNRMDTDLIINDGKKILLGGGITLTLLREKLA